MVGGPPGQSQALLDDDPIGSWLVAIPPSVLNRAMTIVSADSETVMLISRWRRGD